MAAQGAHGPAAALLVIMLAVAGCGAQPGGGGQRGGGGMMMGSGGATCPKDASAAGATSATSNGTHFLVFSTECPGYDWTVPSLTTNAFNATYQNDTYSWPASPILSTTKTYVGIRGAGNSSNASPLLGPIGLAANGVQIFSDADALSRDAYIYEGYTFDSCRGHPTPSGQYHYHMLPAPGCAFTDTPADQHSPAWGIMADGIPIFGPRGDGGQVPSADDDLDECRGHVDAAYPFYHYHATPDVTTGVYTVKCLRGCLLGNFHNPSYTPSASSCVAAAQQYDYSSLDVVALFQTGARASTPPPAPTSSDASPSPLSPPPPSPGGAVNTNPSPSAGAVMPTGPCDGPRPPRMMGPGGDGPGGMGRGGMGPGGMPDPCMARPMSMPADGQPNGMPTMRDMPDGMPMAGGRPDDMPTMMRHDEPPHAAMPPAPKHSGHQHHKKSPPKPKTKKRPPPVRRVRKPPSPKRQHRKQGGGKL